jgi:FKBP-type peptidyl-prolyl cis-trans isomerase FklB
MKTTLALALALALPTSWAAGAAAPKPQTDAQKSAYSVGFNFGSNLREEVPELDLSVIERGIADAFKGRPSALAPEEMEQIMINLRKSVKAEKDRREKAIIDTNKEAGERFLAGNAKKPGVTTLPSGLQYQVLSSGKGDGPSPTLDDNVKVIYKGTLLNGKVFDSNLKREAPTSFPMSNLTRGWAEGLHLMKAGDKWKIFIPANLGYGPGGVPGIIPPESTLIYEVELLEIDKSASSSSSY